MKIGIDLKPLYTGSKYRGIGIYTKQTIRELLKLDRTIEFHFLNLYGDFPEDLELDERCFVHSYYNGPTVIDCGERKLYRVPELDLVREAQIKNFLASSGIDVMLFTSPNEYGNMFRSEWFAGVPTATILYDLIPLVFPEQCLFDQRYKNDYMQSLDFLKGIDCCLAISEATKRDTASMLQLHPDKIHVVSSGIEATYFDVDKSACARKSNRKYGEYFLFAGGIDFKKNIDLIIEAYSQLAEAEKSAVGLVIVGKASSDTLEHYLETARRLGVEDKVICTGFVSDEELISLYCGAKALVFPSLYEGFGLPVIEAMACGTPVITSNGSSLKEIAEGHALLVNPKKAREITAAMHTVLSKLDEMAIMVEEAIPYAHTFTWKSVAEKVYEQLCALAKTGKPKRKETSFRVNDAILSAIAHEYREWNFCLDEKESTRISNELYALEVGVPFPAYPGGIRILLDITVAHDWFKNNYITGIGRVCLELYYALKRITNTVAVCGEAIDGELIFHPVDMNSFEVSKTVLELKKGDIYFMPEFQVRGVQIPKNYPHPDILRKQGLKCYAVVYDILPLQMPQYFEKSTAKEFHFYLKDILKDYDGILTDSKAVSDEVIAYARDHSECRSRETIKIGYFHCGVDIAGAQIGNAIIPELVQDFFSGQTFLMVGSVEPRKGHALVLDTFERLWNQGNQARLCIIGRAGWNMQEFLDRVKAHPEKEKRLLFLEGASDEILQYAYQNAAALIQASAGEGFGLPLIEAGSYGLPVICSDIPVFHEVAEENALYFDRESNDGLLELLVGFGEMKRKGQIPDSNKIQFQSWDDTACQVANMIAADTGWYCELLPDGEAKECEKRQAVFQTLELPELEDSSNEGAILLIYPNNFYQGGQGNNNRVHALIKAIKDLGYEIDLFSLSNFGGEGQFDHFSEQNQEGLIRNLYLYDMKTGYCEDHAKRLSIPKNLYLQDWTTPGMHLMFQEILGENSYQAIGIFYAYFINLLQNSVIDAKRLYFMEDSSFLQQLSWRTGNENDGLTLGKLLDEELNRLSCIDELFCISYDEKIMYERFLHKEVHFLPHLMPETSIVTTPVESRKWDVAFIGANNPFNVEGMNWFVEEVCPLLDEKVHIVLVGKMTTELRTHPKCVEIIPFAEDLDALFNDVKIAICPMFRGTGMKIKVVESMARGLPIVCNERGVDGLPDKWASGCLVTNDAEEFAGYINRLVSDPKFYEQRSKQIKEYYQNVFNRERYVTLLKTVLLGPG